jgi:hypothetical protein
MTNEQFEKKQAYITFKTFFLLKRDSLYLKQSLFCFNGYTGCFEEKSPTHPSNKDQKSPNGVCHYPTNMVNIDTHSSTPKAPKNNECITILDRKTAVCNKTKSGYNAGMH